jgi:gamma-glutamylcysteine synthetase
MSLINSVRDNVTNTSYVFLISNFRRVLNIVCFLLGNSPESELYMPTFRNTLSVPSS